MTLEEIARSILLGGSWEEKLAFDPAFTDGEHAALTELPAFPGRPARLARLGKAEFPTVRELVDERARGRLLHFFANHELLAMELMALVLLRFPEAPREFRAGIARTIAEEQSHLRLYVERMGELGVGFGDCPVSDYFWNAMRGMRSPLEFVTQMSLTLEQANLDFSLEYQRVMVAVGDAETAAILERVYREEIGHVKHGVAWFNRWRGDSASESDWDAYRRLLPAPMTPRRAKGSGALFAADPRREAGLSERFISELEVYSSSRGRPPVFWHYNPLCDAEIARGKPGHTGSASAARVGADLETLPMFGALASDVVLVSELPRAEWLRGLKAAGFAVPEFRLADAPGGPSRLPREDRIAGLEPWGWSPDSFARFRGWRQRLVGAAGANGEWARALLERESFGETGLGPVFSKAWSAGFLREWLEARAPADRDAFGPLEAVGAAYPDWPAARTRLEQALLAGETWLAKAPWATAGAGNRRVLAAGELDGPLGGWIQNVIRDQGSIVLEPWLDKQADLSMQMVIGPVETRLLGIRQFYSGSRLEYRGTRLDARLSALPEAARRFLHGPLEPLARWRRLALALGRRLRQAGYQGPAGIDALLWRRDESLFLKPLVELNPRWTMGRVALELERHVKPGVPAEWSFAPASARPDLEALARAHPPVIEGASGESRIAAGVILTTDPERAREVLTVLKVGAAALGF